MTDKYPLDQVARRHNIVLTKLADFAFWASGWKLVGQVANLPKFLVVAAPHRSGWEVALGFMTICTLSIDVRWMAKHTIFRWPIGPIARWFGGIAIDRRKAHGVVENTVQQFNQNKSLCVVVMPEGTRSKVDVPVSKWKKGYYYIAYKASVPIMPLYLDHANKRIVLGETISMVSDQQSSAKAIQEFYDNEREISRSLAQR